ncbi:MAG: response regulator, partial [Rhodospirillales bacterium]
MRVLVIEDDQEAAGYMAKGLREHGYVVDHAATGPDGLAMATAEAYDLLIVDRMLPGMDGLVIVEALRKSGNQSPILFLSALAQVDDRVKGLQAGG